MEGFCNIENAKDDTLDPDLEGSVGTGRGVPDAPSVSYVVTRSTVQATRDTVFTRTFLWQRLNVLATTSKGRGAVLLFPWTIRSARRGHGCGCTSLCRAKAAFLYTGGVSTHNTGSLSLF